MMEKTFEENHNDRFDLIDEKDFWEDGEVCRECGLRLPETIKGEYVCPECGATYVSK